MTALDAIGDLLAELVAAGAAIRGPAWRLDPDNPVHDEVREAAAQDARRRATSYARGLSLEAGDVVWMAEPGLRPESDGWAGYAQPAALRVLSGDSDEEQPISLSPAEVRLSASVEVAFALTTGAAQPGA